MLRIDEITTLNDQSCGARVIHLELRNQDTQHSIAINCIRLENEASNYSIGAQTWVADPDLQIQNQELARLLIALAGQLLHVPNLMTLGFGSVELQ
jgi:hypothetical protein